MPAFRKQEMNENKSNRRRGKSYECFVSVSMVCVRVNVSAQRTGKMVLFMYK